MDRARALGRAGRVNLFPGGIYRQFVRHVVLGHGITGVELAGIDRLFRAGLLHIIFLLLQQGVVVERLLNFLLEFQSGELEQTNRLL